MAQVAVPEDPPAVSTMAAKAAKADGQTKASKVAKGDGVRLDAIGAMESEPWKDERIGSLDFLGAMFNWTETCWIACAQTLYIYDMTNLAYLDRQCVAF